MNREMRLMIHALPIRFLSVLTALAIATLVSAQDDAQEGGLTGTGIYGIVAKTEPLVVNGHNVSASDAILLSDPIGVTSPQYLATGNVVAMRVNFSEAAWDAVSIQRFYAMIGPIQEATDNRLTIMGTDVAVSNMDISALRPGDWVAVSGFWREADLSATRIDAVPPQAFAHMTGTYFAPTQDSVPHFGTSQLMGLAVDTLAQGTVVTVTGQPRVSGIEVVRQVDGIFDEDVWYVSAQGYLSNPKADGFYTLIGSGLIAFTDDLDMDLSATPVVFCGIAGNLFDKGITSTSDAERAYLNRLGC